MYGHQKFKTGAIRSFGNVLAYVQDFGGSWKTPGTIADEPNVMFSNKVWFAVPGAQAHNDGLDEWVGNRSYDNHFVGINVRIGRHDSLAQWQALNPSLNDVNSTSLNVSISTQAAEIMAAARELLAPILKQH